MADDSVEDLLDDESLAEKEFYLHTDGSQVSPLRHSATTGTLDSVYLEPSVIEEDVQDIITAIPDLVKADPIDADSEGIVVKAGGDTTDLSEFLMDEKVEAPSQQVTNNEVEPKMNISSYFADQNSIDDPFSSSAFVSVGPEEPQLSKQGDIESVENNDNELQFEDIQPPHQPLESKLSHEEPESVDFQLESDTNVMEASMQLIDEKEDFEMFTAENDPNPDFTEYGVSPGTSLLAERMNSMHMSESDHNETDQISPGFDRQISSASQHSIGSGHGSEQGPPPPLPVSQFSSNQFSPFATPTHQPIPPPINVPPTQLHSQPISPAVEAVSPVGTDASAPNSAKSYKTPPPTTLFSDTGDDVFLSSIQMSDSDRQHDAWLPGDHSNFTPVAENLSTPGLVVNEPQGDPVRDLVYRYMGEQEAIKRQVLTVDSVPQDVDGLKKLIEGGCFRSAIDLTGRLLTEAGQGADKIGQITTHSSNSLQLWFCRLALLMKLRYYSIAESEFQAFQNLDTPDLYYEYYPRIYPGRKGSMVPFGMRILHAELPHYLGRSHEALDRLYYILAVAQKIVKNLDDSLAEDGSGVQITEESRKVSKDLWLEREKQVMYIIGNTFLAIKDYEAAISMFDSILKKDSSNKGSLLSGMGRIYLQIGNVPKAKECFKQAEVLSDSQDNLNKCRNFINRGLEGMCLNNFSEAYQNFKKAVECDPTNSSAVNNMSVCSLYLGKLMDALKSLEVLVHEDPKKNLHEGVLFNLCTLYELESSRALHKKQALLDLVSRHKGDGFPVACLKMA